MRSKRDRILKLHTFVMFDFAFHAKRKKLLAKTIQHGFIKEILNTEKKWFPYIAASV